MLPEYFEFYNPVKLLCGQWSLENIPYELGRLRVKKPLMLVSGTMLQQGILQMMGEPMPMVLESGIPQDSSFELVERLAAHAREEGCDGVVAIGGGSVLDTAKAVRVLLEQEQTALRRLLGSEWMSRAQRVIPFIMVPTTSGTGSECTAVAVVMDEKNGCKQEIVSDRFLPDVAVLDPRCTEKLPPRQTAACGMDALVHAMEAYTCRQKNPLSDAYARTAVEMIGKNLIAAVRQPDSQEYRLAMACASAMAGMAFSNSMVGLVHAIGHALGAVCSVPHGEAVGLLLPWVMRWQMDCLQPQYAQLLAAFCGTEYYAHIPEKKCGEALVKAIEEMLVHLHQKTGIPARLRDAQVHRQDFSKIAQKALEDGALLVNPKAAGKQDILEILDNAY